MTAPPLLLSLHSCSDCFGMALLDPQQPGAEPLVEPSSGQLLSRTATLPPAWIRLEAGAGAHIPLNPGLAIGEIHHRHVDAGRVWLKIRCLG